MAESIQLKNPPIREIIFTISFNENVGLHFLEKFVNLTTIKKDFPNVVKGFHANIREREGEVPETRVSNDGYILKNEQENRILRVKRGSFSFHVVKEYRKFNVLVDELKPYWADLDKCLETKLSINNIAVRYLNFIEKDLDEPNKEWVNVYNHHPFSTDVDGLSILKFPYPGQDAVTAIVTTANTNNDDNSKAGVILDITINKKVKGEMPTSKFFDLISELHQIKNDAFFACVTEKTIKKYNQ